MIDINLIPEQSQPAPAGPRWPTAVLALGGAFVAVLLVINAYYAFSVIPRLERQVAEKEAILEERRDTVAALTREASTLAARREWVAAAKGIYADKPLYAPLLAHAQKAIVDADAALGGDGAIWLHALEAGGGALRLQGFVTGPGADAAVAAIADALTAAGNDASVDALEPVEDGTQRFAIRAAVTP
ncbi:MAG: hypothetical protein LUE17_03480 [Planctomycetaceae bacterium]|nr:hypothetical protein [Planctomycetaceae bacterium]